MTEWGETLGYLVADSKLTQDHMIELLTQYLDEISFFGTDPEKHRIRIEKLYADLKQAEKEIEEGQTVPAEEVHEMLAREYGFPIDEKDDVQEKYRAEISKAEITFSRYCNWRERSQILQSLGETAPAFEENYELL